MIQVKNLRYSIGNKRLVDGLSFDVHPGEHLAIVGANGAGKSTLLKLLSRELPYTDGEIMIRGKALKTYKPAALARFRAVLAQQTTLSISFTVREIVGMGRYPHFDNRPSVQDHAIVQQAMEETGVSKFSDRDYNTLSGGEQQRVQLARVLAQIYDQPEGILFLDEPTNGLDLLYQQQILGLARSLANRSYCVVSILHDVNVAARYADKVLILKQGKIIAFGPPAGVINCENIHQAFNIHVKLIQDDDSLCPFVVPSLNLSLANK
jgi:iron complex transport system ATP-binding protein